jgi:serine/threonine protein kinase
VPLEEALQIARQIADALEAAHEMGVVHRDLKPANIKVKPDGTVKVLYFGLATQSVAREGEESAVTMTTPGTILGIGMRNFMPKRNTRWQNLAIRFQWVVWTGASLPQLGRY